MEVYSAKAATCAVVERAKVEGKTVIGTHSCTHHCDEVTSCVLLCLLYPHSVIIRQRDEEVLKLCDIVVDVGGVYDAARRRFDHHQKTFGDTWSPEKTVRLSSAGLVWKHYGKELLGKLCEGVADVCVDDELVAVVYDLVFESIDAADNGTKSCACGPADYHYVGGLTGLAGLVGAHNTGWTQVDDESDCFKRAAALVETHLLPFIRTLASHWRKAVAEFKAAEKVPLGSSGKFALRIKNYYAYSKFLKYILTAAEAVGVVGTVWCSVPEQRWYLCYRPAPWGKRFPFVKLEDASSSTAELPAASEAEIVAKLVRIVEAPPVVC